MRAWRLLKAQYLADAFSGEGARYSGGRWNSPGIAVVYAAEHLSLAALELLVHLRGSQHLDDYVSIPVDIEAALVETLDPATLPADWRSYPAPPQLKLAGDRWIAEVRSAALRVPSALIPSESNFLLNPAHPDFEQVELGDPQTFLFDARLR